MMLLYNLRIKTFKKSCFLKKFSSGRKADNLGQECLGEAKQTAILQHFFLPQYSTRDNTLSTLQSIPHVHYT